MNGVFIRRCRYRSGWVRKSIIARNGPDPRPRAPFFFRKNPDSIVVSGGAFLYPAGYEIVHCEIEIEVV